MLVCAGLLATPLGAATRYAAPDGGHVPPFTNGWAGAATNIQDAVDVAAAGDVVLVSNGVYATGTRVTPGSALLNRVVITNAITLRGAFGPPNTVILGAPGAGGGNGPGAVRGVFMSAGTLEGLTISNGHTSGDVYSEDRLGGGVRCMTFCVISNCIISGNRAVEGGGVHGQGTVIDSLVMANHAELFGGGVVLRANARLIRCMVIGNTATNGGGAYGDSSNTTAVDSFITNNHARWRGGGVYSQGMLFEHCTLAGNTCDDDGGGFYGYGGGMNRCIVSGNRASNRGGGAWCYASQITNCLIIGNTAVQGGGMACDGCFVVNTTVSSNSAGLQGGGMLFVAGSMIFNSICYDNDSPSGNGNWHSVTSTTPLFIRNSCITPTNELPGIYLCIADAPLFYQPGADYHLLEGSPCIDSGVYMPWAMGAVDLDGNPRYMGAGIDMGCYEAVPEPGAVGVLLLCTMYNLRCTIWRRRGEE